MIKKKLFLTIQYLLPQHLLSRAMGWLANCKKPWLKNWMITNFIRHYQVNMEEAEYLLPQDYQNFNAFFTRKLQAQARTISDKESSIISPVDGYISQIGHIDRTRIFQAKGHHFNLLELLGGDDEQSQIFLDGHFATLYLSPRDYHRVHMPCDGQLTGMTHIPGKLFSVNHTTAENIPNLFARNERVACFFDTRNGPMAVIFVGAFFVASIKTTWHGIVNNFHHGKIEQWRYAKDDQRHYFQQGDELGQFQFGSTVILLFPKQQTTWDEGLKHNDTIRFGQQIGHQV